MPTVRQIHRSKSLHTLWLALAILGIGQPDTAKAAIAGANSKSFAITANVARRCSIAVDSANVANLERGAHRNAVAASPGQAVIIACSRGARQNVRIGNGANAPAKIISLAEPVRQKLLIENAQIVTVDF